MPTLRPESIAAVCDLMRQARADSQAVAPLGGGTMRHYGMPPRQPALDLDLTGLADVIDYPARDMTITVQAGMRLQQLQRVLAQEKQRLPLDVPHPESATVGGAIAANASGPRRFGYGSWRDYVIGLSAVNDEGRAFKAGGRVVKNVAGYDLCKLLTGSFGTLAILTQITLKIRPCPEAGILLGAHCPLARLADVLESLHRTQTRPCAVEVLSRQAARELGGEMEQDPLEAPTAADELVILIGFEDNADAVRWQTQRLAEEWATHRIAVIQSWHGDDHALWSALQDYPLAQAAVTFQASVPPSKSAEFLRLALPEVPRLQMHAGNGVAVGHASESFTLAQLENVRTAAESWGGSLVVHRCPEAWRQPEFLWGKERPDRALMRRVKRQLDPRNLFNPGRFLAD